MFYLKIGFRNLLKNRRRTVLTMLTIVIGMSALIMAKGFINYSLWGYRESIINGGVGHFQIYKKGFLEHGDERPFDYLITDYKKIIRQLFGISGMKTVTPRLRFQGMITSVDKSAIVFGTAGIPEDEAQFTTFSRLNDGKRMNDSDPYSLTIGGGLAKSISAKPGDPCTIIVSMKDGSVNAFDFNISGVVQSQIAEYDNVYALANLKTVQKLLDISNSIDTLAVMMTKTEYVARAEQEVKDLCKGLGLEYRRWDQIVPYYYVAEDFYNSAMNVALLIIFAIVIFAVANTMNMVIFERIREIGTIRSLGTTRMKVMKIFISESFLLGLFGSILGIITGMIITLVINYSGGIPIPPPPGNSRGYQAFIQPGLLDCLIYFMLFIIVSLLAVIYPVLKSVRMAISDTLSWI